MRRPRCAPSPQGGEGGGEGARVYRETVTPHPTPLPREREQTERASSCGQVDAESARSREPLLLLPCRTLRRGDGPVGALRRGADALPGAVEHQAGVVVHVARKRLDVTVGGEPQP